jgi:protein-tyrosine phosphatase
MPRPRGGDWLEDEVHAWRQAGIEVVVSTLMQDEIDDLDLINEAALCRREGIEFVSLPILDRGVPESLPAMTELVRKLETSLAEGKNVAIHCRMGIGRSSLLAACLLVVAGVDPETAFERIRDARGCAVPDTIEQREWVARFARYMRTAASEHSNTR